MFEEAVAHIFRGFTDIVSGLHMSAVHTPSFLDIAKYLIIFLVGPMTAVIAYDQFFPIFEGVNLYLVIVICTLILLVTPALLFGFFRYFGGHWLLNWHMKKTSRYLDFCRMPREYIASLLPKDTWKWQYRLVGSSADHGFGFFPLLNLNSGILPRSNPIIVQDVDVNVFYKPLHISMDQLIPTMPGYCQVVIDGFIEDAFLKDCIVKGGKQSFLSGRLVSQKIGTEFLDGNIEFNYPAITFKTILDGPRGKFRFDCDVVFAVKIHDSAAVFYDWCWRVEDTFPLQLLDRIRTGGCYVVHKHCAGNHLCHDFDWRITFAQAESELFEYHSDKAALKLCYAIIKFAVKQFSHVKKRNYPALKSYHLKTVILWIAEQSKKLPYDMFTIDNNKTLGGLLLHIISTYRQHIFQGHLEHYFMKHINILEPYGVEERTAAMQLLDEFKMKPLAIVSNFDSCNMSRWKFDQFFIISLLVVVACLWFNFYYSNLGIIFEPVSVVKQIYRICGVFCIILIIKILLD